MWTRPYDTGANAGMLFGFGVYDLFRSNQGLGFNTAVGDLYGLTPGQLHNATFYGNWMHIVCVMQQTTSYTNNKIYINGPLITNVSQVLGTEQASSRNFNNGFMRINGWYINDSYPYRQDVAIFRVYKKELSQAEVWQNYNANRTRTLFSRPAIRNIVPDGLKFYTDMEGELDWFALSGSYIKDYSGFCFFGTLFGGAAWNSGFGGYMPLRTANGRYIDIGRGATSSGFGLSYGSASFVMMVRSINMDIFEYIFGRPDVAPSYGNDVNIAFNGHGVRYSHNDGNNPQTFATGPMAHNVWYHVVMTYNYNTYVVQIYVNGVLVVSNGFSERMTGLSGNSYALGRVNSTNYNYDLGLFMIYNRVISESEVTTLYEAQKTRFGIVNNGIVRSNNILYWDFGNTYCYPGTGDAVTDLLNYDYNGLAYGTTYSSADGGKFTFVKSENDFINANGSWDTPAVVGTSNFSIEVWTKPTNENHNGVVVGNGNAATGDRFNIVVGTPDSNGNIVSSKKIGTFFFENNQSYGRSFYTNNDIVDGNWKHIVITRNASTFKIYVNGVEQTLTQVGNLGSGTPSLNTDSIWRINDNGSNNGTGGINMDLSVWRLYNAELSLSQVQQNYNAEKSRFGL